MTTQNCPDCRLAFALSPIIHLKPIYLLQNPFRIVAPYTHMVESPNLCCTWIAWNRFVWNFFLYSVCYINQMPNNTEKTVSHFMENNNIPFIFFSRFEWTEHAQNRFQFLVHIIFNGTTHTMPRNAFQPVHLTDFRRSFSPFFSIAHKIFIVSSVSVLHFKHILARSLVRSFTWK